MKIASLFLEEVEYLLFIPGQPGAIKSDSFHCLSNISLAAWKTVLAEERLYLRGPLNTHELLRARLYKVREKKTRLIATL